MKLPIGLARDVGSSRFTTSACSLYKLAPVLALGLVGVVHAATNTVTALADSGPGSLRQALANSASGDSIVFKVVGTITLSNELAIANPIAIIGPGDAALAISGGQVCRVLNISPSATASISGLTIQDGQLTASASSNSGYAGGGIQNAGTLLLSNCVICGNVAGTDGGGIYNQGNCLLSNCAIQNNRAGGWGGQGGDGGGIYNCGTCVMYGCTVAGNYTGSGANGASTSGFIGGSGGCGGNGGGICSLAGISLVNCTLTNNYCGGGGLGGVGQYSGGAGGGGGWGGGVYGDGNLTGCTIAFNSAGNGGEGGHAFASGGEGSDGGPSGFGGGVAGTFHLTNCTIVGNSCGVGGPANPTTYCPNGYGGNGGGIYIYALGSGDTNGAIVACTIVGNAAGLGGANGSAPPGTVGFGGGICAQSGTEPLLLDDIVALNCVGTDVDGDFQSPGPNLIGSEPDLGALANNGGPTLTMALQPGSPAINAGSAMGAPVSDQRGLPRPQGPGVDLGAFEFQYLPVLTDVSIQGTTNRLVLVSGFWTNANLTVQVSSSLLTWLDATNSVAWTNGMFQFLDPAPAQYPARYYRLKIVP